MTALGNFFACIQRFRQDRNDQVTGGQLNLGGKIARWQFDFHLGFARIKDRIFRNLSGRLDENGAGFAGCLAGQYGKSEQGKGHERPRNEFGGFFWKSHDGWRGGMCV